MTAKKKLDEIEKIVGETGRGFGWTIDDTNKLRRKLRALVRKALKCNDGYSSLAEECFKETFGFRP